MKFKTILKFDAGADVFLKMIYVLATTAVVVVILGVYYIITTF
ncbi:MAG: hypothetical protein ACI8Q2_000572 [Candidatus Omnitrophota bacterium]|jgi:hypothetical protein